MSRSKRQHFLPATYLACFSADGNKRRRERTVAQGDRKTGKCNQTRAENLAGIAELYTLEERARPNIVDDIWSKYEASLADCIYRLIDGTITARDWATVLVPFVTCILVRGEEFEDRFNKRLGPMREAAIREDNAKAVRIIEIQRLLAPVLVAEWTVITLAEAGEPLIVNDWARLPAGPGLESRSRSDPTMYCKLFHARRASLRGWTEKLGSHRSIASQRAHRTGLHSTKRWEGTLDAFYLAGIASS